MKPLLITFCLIGISLTALASTPRELALKTLGLKDPVSNREIAQTYRWLAVQNAPDLNQHLTEGGFNDKRERFKEAAEAYEFLIKGEAAQSNNRFRKMRSVPQAPSYSSSASDRRFEEAAQELRELTKHRGLIALFEKNPVFRKWTEGIALWDNVYDIAAEQVFEEQIARHLSEGRTFEELWELYRLAVSKEGPVRLSLDQDALEHLRSALRQSLSNEAQFEEYLAREVKHLLGRPGGVDLARQGFAQWRALHEKKIGPLDNAQFGEKLFVALSKYWATRHKHGVSASPQDIHSLAARTSNPEEITTYLFRRTLEQPSGEQDPFRPAIRETFETQLVDHFRAHPAEGAPFRSRRNPLQFLRDTQAPACSKQLRKIAAKAWKQTKQVQREFRRPR